jgi:2-dehydropantoate 2-reductase
MASLLVSFPHVPDTHRFPKAMSAPNDLGRIAVMGAGAVGCYYGGMLARAGHEVTLIARPQHVEAVQKRGLRMETKAFDANIPMQASAEASGAGGAKLVLFSVKSPDTERAGAALAPYLDPEAVVLSLQNGVDNAERLAAVLGREVVPAVVYAAVEMTGPGHVRHHGRGELVIGRSARSPDIGARIAAAFGAAGVPVEVSDNVSGTLWAKLIVNCAYNALSAIAQLPYGRLVQGDGIPAVMRDVVDECLAVARAAGIEVPGDMRQATTRIAETMPGQFSSTAQDLARGKPTEIDHLNGFVVRKGEGLGVPTPANRMLVALVKLLEERGSPRE